MAHPQFESVSHIFKANDIRGLLEEVTPELARAVAYALVQKTAARTVLVGRDMRETSPELLEAAVEGIHAAGKKAVVIGMCTTSMFNWAVSQMEDIDAGLMITASHNPSQYNGIKIAYHNGLPISGSDIFLMLPTAIPEVQKTATEEREVIELYVQHFMEVAGLKEGDGEGIKVAVDFGNGMGAITVKRVLELLGVEALYLYDEPDARFPNHEANPSKRETLKDLQELMKESGAQLGVALDGDADRIGFMDANGRVMRGDQMLGLLTEILSAQQKIPKVVVAPNFGWDALEAIEKTGAELVQERIGRTFVIKKMREVGAPLGGELSSHFFFEATRELESVDYVLMLVLKGMKESGKSFAQMTDHLHRYINSGEINLHVEKKDAAILKVKMEFAGVATTMSDLDGVRCDFEKDWWFILRPSNTEPLLRLTVESCNEELLQEKIALMRELIGGEQEQ